MGGKAYLVHPSSYFAKVGNKQDIDKAFREVVRFAEDFMQQYSPDNNPKTHIDGAEVYHISYLGNMEVISEIKELVKKYRLGSSRGTDIHVNNTLGKNENVSSDGLGGNVTKNKLRKYKNLRRKAIGIDQLRRKIIAKADNETER